MDYGLNQKGLLIQANKAQKHTEYECPYCSEKLTLNISKIQKSYFSHHINKERTPLERTCPEYQESNGSSIVSDELEIIYINNGGVPLYLHKTKNNNKFELRAYFPEIDSSIDKFKTLVRINNNCYISKYREEYYASNLNFYNVRTIQKWIDIDIVTDNNDTLYNEKDLKNKWLWGIRGINFKKDIYHCNKDGGYRVALKSNIIINKKYLIILKNNIQVDGIEFCEVGYIDLVDLKNKNSIYSSSYKIFEMTIRNSTKDSVQFIEQKGYKLRYSNNFLSPIWPPHIKYGKQIITNNNNLFFYIKEINDIDKLEETIEIEMDNRFIKYSPVSNVINIPTTKNTTLFKNFHRRKMISSEILFNIYNYNFNINNYNTIASEKKFKITNMDNELVEFQKLLTKKLFNKKYKVISDFKIEIIVKQNDLVIYSDNCIIDKLDFNRELIIIINNLYYYNYICDSDEIDKNLDVSKIINILNIPSNTYVFDQKYIKILNYIFNTHSNIIEYGYIKNKILYEGIPIEAKQYLDSVWRSLDE